MPNTPEQTLQGKVQTFRDKAREILRMRMISDLLQQLFRDDCRMTNAQKGLAEEEKQLEIARYNQSKLDEKHPSFATQTETSEKTLKCAEARIKNVQKMIEQEEEAKNETLAEIAKVETGEVKVSIESVKRLTDEMVMKG